MRLIDAHKVQMKLSEECQKIRYFDKDRKKPQIFADGIDFAWVMLDNQPTVEAIPIEWFEWLLDTMGDGMYNLRAVIKDWKRYKEDWEKENDRNQT